MSSAIISLFAVLCTGSASGREGGDGALPLELRLEGDGRRAPEAESFALLHPAGMTLEALQEAAKPAPQEAAPAAKPAAPQDPAAAQEGGPASHGPFSIGGRLMVDHSARETDASMGTSTIETTLVSLGLSLSYYADADMKHELGGEVMVNLNESTFNSTDTHNTSINWSVFYQYNYPLDEKMKLILGSGVGWGTNLSDTVDTIEWTFDVRLGLRVFLSDKISLDLINKLVFGFGHDDSVNEDRTNTVGYNLLIGVTYFFGE